MALDFIREHRDDPFFCFLSQLEPHHQNEMDDYVAPEGYAYQYREPWVPEDLEDEPGDWYQHLPDYYGICRRLDESYGRIRETLRELGIAENTIVLYTSDHGSHFCTRNFEYKRSCHEASVRVPAVLTGPGFEDGGRVDELVSLLDVPPTLLDAAGIDVPDAMDGRSVRPLVDGTAEDWRDEVFIQISESGTGRALRTDRWKYAVRAPDGENRPRSDTYVERYLYDLAADPHEEVNLVGRDAYADVAADLRERLEARIAAAEDEPSTIEPADSYA
jgi:arylsulfatase A-like enzyme